MNTLQDKKNGPPTDPRSACRSRSKSTSAEGVREAPAPQAPLAPAPAKSVWLPKSRETQEPPRFHLPGLALRPKSNTDALTQGRARARRQPLRATATGTGRVLSPHAATRSSATRQDIGPALPKPAGSNSPRPEAAGEGGAVAAQGLPLGRLQPGLGCGRPAGARSPQGLRCPLLRGTFSAGGLGPEASQGVSAGPEGKGRQEPSQGRAEKR